MNRDKRTGNGKLPYRKPRLRRIRLAAEEVLAPGCKLSGGGSAVGAPSNCIDNSCAGVGS